MATNDPIVEEYLRGLKHELRDVPKGRADEVVAEVRAHIAESLPEASTEAVVRNVLELLGDPADIAAEARERFPDETRSHKGLYLTVSAVLIVAAVLGAFLLLRPRGPYDYRGAIPFTDMNQLTCMRFAHDPGISVTVTASTAGKDMGNGAAKYEWTQGGCWLVWSFPLDRAASYMLTFKSEAGVYPGPSFTASQLNDAGSNMTYQIAEFPNGLSV